MNRTGTTRQIVKQIFPFAYGADIRQIKCRDDKLDIAATANTKFCYAARFLMNSIMMRIIWG
jgi:hypothetical protein